VALRRPLPTPEPARATAYLVAGQVFASASPTVVTTVLGSCVAVCLWDPLTRIGGMNHYILPFAPPTERPSPRYGETAIVELLSRLVALGAAPQSLQAKVFGGAHVLRELTGTLHLGARNVELAERSLQTLGIPVRERAAGGTAGRKLVFHTDDGTSLVKEL
jgi:chemotaxis protein CheD